MEIFIANFKYGKASLAKATIVKETPKMYWVKDSTNIIGWQYVGRTVNKGYNVSINYKYALRWMSEKAREYANGCKDSLRKAVEQANKLEELYEETD